MKLSGHSYNNSVFESLLDNMKDDITIKTASKKAEPVVNGLDVFSSQTQANFDEVLNDELDFIAKELEFAADKSKVAITIEDMAKFASQVRTEGLRGKKLERAAQKFCNDLNRSIAAPQGTTRLSNSLVHQLASITPAAYPTNAPGGQNDSMTGKFMGCSKNPNTIWDSEALTRFASVKHGDEMIKESKNKISEERANDKQAYWQELQNKHSEPNQLHNGITKSANATPQTYNQKLPDNSMSLFDSNRDFENIPEETLGEKIAKLAKDRAEKRAEAKSEWNKVEPAQTTSSKSWLNKIFK